MITVLLTVLAVPIIAETENKEYVLGWTMVFVALYFLLTISLVPHFSDIDRIYRLSVGREVIPWGAAFLCVETGLAIFFGIGFLRAVRGVSSWK